jgi:hypothetical protein
LSRNGLSAPARGSQPLDQLKPLEQDIAPRVGDVLLLFDDRGPLASTMGDHLRTRGIRHDGRPGRHPEESAQSAEFSLHHLAKFNNR